MKILSTAAVCALLLVPIASPSEADDRANDSVRWATIIGIEQAGNKVDGITGGGQPWSTRGGEVHVKLIDGTVEFEVRGLVLAGGNAIGTPDAVTQVKGTLVCGPGSATPVVIDTPLVPLSPQGNAQLEGSFSSSTASCSATDVAFLVRTAGGAWIANGSVRVP